MTQTAAPILCIDGPSGVGKGTVSIQLGRHLGWHILDSGSLYRVLAWQAAQQKLPLADAPALCALAGQMQVRCVPDAVTGEMRIYADEEDISEAIRSEENARCASEIAAIAAVRATLLDWQRAYCQPPGLIADGRDMGTVVFPAANLKVYLLASIDQRVQRRLKQLKKKGISVSVHKIKDSIVARDERDRTREVSPSLPADDAVVIDTTHRDVPEVCAMILERLSAVMPELDDL